LPSDEIYKKYPYYHNSIPYAHMGEKEVNGIKLYNNQSPTTIVQLYICQIQSRARALTIIPRRAIFRIGMLLRDSEVAKKVRTYLLNVEENATPEEKLRAVELLRENKQHIELLENKILLMDDKLNRTNTYMEELMHSNFVLNQSVEKLLSQPLFKINENMSHAYDQLMIEFVDIMEMYGIKNKYKNNYSFFNAEFGNWVNVKFNNKVNKKQYWIFYYGIDIIKQFVYGIKQEIIIKSQQGNWISKSGVYTNSVEWLKLLEEFNHSCVYCGISDKETIMVADHILPQTHEKSTDCIYNIVPCCSDCNRSKGTSNIRDWYTTQSFFDAQKFEHIKNHWKMYFFE
jgi:hypothetical protein